MKRRIFGLFMALVMMLSLVPTVVFASETVASGTCGAEGDNLTWTLDDAGTLTISGTGDMADSTHPYNEDSIRQQWYDYRNDITRIVVEDGVTSIGVYAFYSIGTLRDISLPNSLTEIGAYAFDGCYCISEITIPDSVTSIGECAFAGCNSLDSVTIPESVAFIGNRAFGSCYYLTQIVVSDANPNFCNDDNGVLFTKDKTMLLQCPDAFSGAYTIPDSVTAIDDRAFYGCNGLTAITIPGSVESIGSYLFADCNSLTNVTICNGVTSIGSSAFSYCSALTDVTIPNSVTYIGDNAFGGCTSLANLEIPNSVTSIGDRAFWNCNSLTSVKIPDSVTSIGDRAFADCDSLTNVEIPDSVTSIGSGAFKNCNSLAEISISEAMLANINVADVFGGTLWYINNYGVSGSCGDDLTWNLDGNGVLTVTGSGAMDDYMVRFDADEEILPPWWNYKNAITQVVIEDGVTYIGEGAFGYEYEEDDRASYPNLTTVSFPDSLTEIGAYAFTYCQALTDIVLPTHLEKINGSAFLGCGGLRDVTIPASVTDLAIGAFSSCNNMTAINIAEDNEVYSSIDGVVFNKAETELIRCPAGYSGEYIIPNGVTSIGNRAFYFCRNLTSVTIPDSVTSIGDAAFYYCASMSTVTIGNGVERIERSAFQSCDGMTSVVIPENVTYIGEYAFAYSDNLSSVSYSENTEVAETAFEGTPWYRGNPGGGDDPAPEEFTTSGIVYVGENTIDIPDGGMVYYAFTPEESGQYLFTSIGDDDTWGVLYDGDHNFLTENDDGGFGNNFKITWNMNAGEMYYIGIRFYDSISGVITLSADKHDHDYGDGRCECGEIDPNHEHVIGWYGGVKYWDEDADEEVDAGHAAYCAICGEQMSDIEPHDYDGNYCTVCSEVNPNHEHVFDHWITLWGYDEDTEEQIDLGHIACCAICEHAYGDSEPHNFDGNYCITCGAVNSDHECVAEDGWAYGEGYGHYKLCAICGRLLGDEYDHAYEDGRCTVCGAADPDHEHVFGWYSAVNEWDDENCEDIDVGHVACCDICGCWMSDIEPHDYQDNRCTVCGAANPDHECVAEDSWSYGEGYGHYKLCTICGRLVGDEYDHTYENGRCTVCGAADPDHEHVFGWYSAVNEWDDENCEDIDVGHVACCDICSCWMSDIEPHDYQDNRCTVCGAADPAHEHVFGWYSAVYEWDEEKCEDVEVGHAAYCSICYESISDIEPHDYQDNRCTACGAANPNHECVPEYGWSYGEGYGHYKLCTICGRLVGDEYDHTYENGRCTVCGAVDPDHEHVFGYYGRAYQWDEEKCEDVEVGHAAYCMLCDRIMGDIEPHVYDGDYCTACDAVNPDHEHVAGGWAQYREWDEINEKDIDIGHYVYCDICNQKISDIEPHEFQDNYCTVCGAIDPSHEHVSGRWLSDWSEDVENGGHYPICAICYRQIGEEIIPHTFEHGYCTACGAINPGEHIHDYTYLVYEESHIKTCRICSSSEDAEAHTYGANGVCTVCGWMQGAEDITDISIRIGENKELIITLAYANGKSADMTVEKAYMPFGDRLAGNWIARGIWVYTDKGAVRLYFAKDDEGRFCVINTVNRKDRVQSNILDKCEWYDVYSTLWDENLVNPSCTFDGNVWVVDGKAHDGEPVHMTLDGDGNMLTYEIGISSSDVDATLLGDVNNDGKINQKDVARLRQYIGDCTNYPLDAPQNADVNNDGKVNQKDVARLRQYIGDPKAYPLG